MPGHYPTERLISVSLKAQFPASVNSDVTEFMVLSYKDVRLQSLPDI